MNYIETVTQLVQKSVDANASIEDLEKRIRAYLETPRIATKDRAAGDALLIEAMGRIRALSRALMER